MTAVDPIADNTGRRLRADARRNRERIIAAAREVLAVRGEQTQMSDTPRMHAGVGTGTLYRHFPDKESLTIAVIRTPFDELHEIAYRAANLSDPCEAVRTTRPTSNLPHHSLGSVGQLRTSPPLGVAKSPSG